MNAFLHRAALCAAVFLALAPPVFAAENGPLFGSQASPPFKVSVAQIQIKPETMARGAILPSCTRRACRVPLNADMQPPGERSQP